MRFSKTAINSHIAICQPRPAQPAASPDLPAADAAEGAQLSAQSADRGRSDDTDGEAPAGTPDGEPLEDVLEEVLQRIAHAGDTSLTAAAQHLLQRLQEECPECLEGKSVSDIMLLLDDIFNGDGEQEGAGGGDDGAAADEAEGLEIPDQPDEPAAEGQIPEQHQHQNPYQQQHTEEDLPGADTPGKAAYYIKRRAQPLAPGSPVSVLQQCYILATEKMAFKLKDTFIDRHCRYMSHLLGAGNLHPRSWYLVQKVCGSALVGLCSMLHAAERTHVPHVQ